MKDEIKINVLNSGTESEQLRLDLLELLNKYAKTLTGYEMIGVLEVVRNDVHISIKDAEEEE